MEQSEEREKRNAVFGSSPEFEEQNRKTFNADLGLQLEDEVQSVPLPSMGKLYPSTSSLYNKEEVSIRPMKLKELDLLSNQAMIKKGARFLLKTIVKSCLADKTINVDEMTEGDLFCIFVFIRMISFGTDYKAGVECPSCKTNFNDYVFDLQYIEMEKLGLEPASPGENRFSFILPSSKKEVQFKFLSCHDAEELEKQEESLKKRGIPPNSMTHSLLHSLLSVNGETDRGFINRFLQNIKAQDILAIRNFVQKNEPGIKMRQKFECSSCGYTEEIGIPITKEFFFPGD